VDSNEVIVSHSHQNWVTIIDEDFENGFGYFIDEDTTAILYDNFEGRAGVIAIQDTEESDNLSLVSKTFRLGEDISNDKVHSKFKVVFSYHAANMENDDFASSIVSMADQHGLLNNAGSITRTFRMTAGMVA
jgi:hypothetical protein